MDIQLTVNETIKTALQRNYSIFGFSKVYSLRPKSEN